MSISKDLVAGLLFLFTGLAAMALSSQYRFGSMSNLGAGLFPFILGCVLTLLSIPIVVKAILRRRDNKDVIEFNIAERRPLLAVLGSSLLFAILIERAGLFIAVVAMVLVGGLALPKSRPIPAVLLAVGLAIGCVVLFVFALGQPTPVLGTWFGG